MTKFMPLQIAGLIFESLKANFAHEHRPNLTDNFKELMRNLESYTLTSDSVLPKSGPLNFIKL